MKLFFKAKKYKYCLVGLILLIGPFFASPIWVQSNKNSIFDFYAEITGLPFFIYFLIPSCLLIAFYDFLSDLNSSYYDFLAVRYGKSKNSVQNYLFFEILLTFIYNVILFLAALLGGASKGYSCNLDLNHVYLPHKFYFVLLRFNAIFIYMLAFILFLNVMQLLFKRTFVTFGVGAGYIFLLIFVYQSNFSFFKTMPILAGQELFYGIYSSVSWPWLIPYLSLIWIIIEILLLNYLLRRGKLDEN